LVEEDRLKGSIKRQVYKFLRENPKLTPNEIHKKIPRANKITIRQYVCNYFNLERRNKIIRREREILRNPSTRKTLQKTTKPTTYKQFKPKCQNCGERATLNKDGICHKCIFSFGSVYVLDMIEWKWTRKKTTQHLTSPPDIIKGL